MAKYLLFVFLLISWRMQAQTTNTGTISGTVTNEQGNAIPFASVFVMETRQGTITDEQGKFKLLGLKPGNYQIQFSAIGFVANQQSVTVMANQTSQVDFKGKVNIKELQVVTVTAQKRSEDLQKVPGALASIDAKKIQNLQISNINEIGRISPNFKSYDDGAGLFPMLTSRGVFTIDDTPVVGVYIDGVPLFNTASFPASLTDVQRIEVLRGPQGTIYGRNTLAGAINIITQKPNNQIKGFVSAGYGNLDRFTLEGGIGLPLVKDKLFARMSGRYDTRGGYIENTFLQTNDLLARRMGSGNLKLIFYPNEHWDIALTSGLEYRESKAYALVGGFGATGRQLDSLKQNQPYKLNYNTQGNYYTLSSNNALRVSYTTPQFTLTSVSSYQLTEVTRSDEFDFTQFDINSLKPSTRTLNTLAEELRISSNNSKSRFQWLTGLFGYLVKRNETQNIESGVDNAFSAPNPIIAAQYPYLTVDKSAVEQSGFSVFANLTYGLTDHLKVIGGLRYEIERNNTNFEKSFSRNGDPNYTFPALGLVPAQFDETTTFSAISPKLGLSYQMTPEVMTYANVARGYRPGGINSFTTNVDAIVFDPEFSWNYEVGLKTNLWNKRLRANLTGFYIDYEGQQLFTLLDVATFNLGRDNLGRSISYGVELETEWIVFSGLTATLNVGYLETEITDFKVTGFAGEVDNKGNRQGYSPQWNGNLGLNYQKKVGPIKLGVNVDYQYQTAMFFDPENALEQEAYGLLNSRLTIGYKGATLALWAQNLTDELYFSYGYGVSGGGLFANYGLPRTLGTSLTFKF